MTEKMSSVNGSHGTKSSVEKLSNGPSSSSRQPNGTGTKGPVMKPQISIEEAPPSHSQSPTHYSTPIDTSSPVRFGKSSARRERNPRQSNGAHLNAPTKYKKSSSLPHGLAIHMAKRISSSSCDTPESDSCSSDGRQSVELNGGPPTNLEHKQKEKQLDEGKMVRSDSLDSELYLNSTTDDSSSEADASPDLSQRKIFTTRPESSLVDGEDDVFQDGGLDMCAEADMKLVDWAFNVFVPTCRTLLNHCNEERMSTGVIQSDLRNLSNNISFFCHEHQRMSRHLLKPAVVANGKGMPLSVSANSFAKLAKKSDSFDTPTTSADLSASEAESNGYNSTQELLEDRSYAVKILRSISVFLIAPLMQEAAKGFTPALFKSIVVALQKISWRVEACLSFNNCLPSGSKGFEIHSRIFDPNQTVKVRDVMIKALPPEEPKLQTAVVDGSRHSSISSSAVSGRVLGSRKASEPVVNSGPPVGYSPPKKMSLQMTPNGTPVFSPEQCPQDSVAPTQETDDTHSDSKPSEETTPQVMHRAKTTPAVVEGGQSSPRMSRGLSRYGSTPTIDEDDMDYFRPRVYRRTTISLTRKEVHRLGLTVAKRIDESILNEIQAQGESPVPNGAEPGTPAATAGVGGGGEFSQSVQLPQSSQPSDEASELKMEKVHDRLHAKLTKEFNRIRSRSLGDALDPDPLEDPGTESAGELDTLRVPASPNEAGLNQGGSETSSPAPPSPLSPLSPTNITYTPMCGRTNSDTVATKSASDWVFVRKPPNGAESPKSKEKKSKKKREKKQVEKSLSSSGRFAHGLIRTARAIRRGTGTKASLSRSMGSAELLSTINDRPESPIARPASALGDPRPVSHSLVKNEERADTLPPKSKMNTLARLVRRSKSKTTSKSFGKADSSKGTFSKWTQQDFRLSSVFTESIENYSKVVTKPLPPEGEEQLLVSVDVAGKLAKPKPQRRKSVSKEATNTWFEITVTTNIKQFGRNHYTILRPFKEFQQLYDAMATSHVGPTYQLPERPEKKHLGKLQGQQMEELLRCIAGNPSMRASPPFVGFLMPDDAFGTFHDTDSEVSFELLMTFYTPDTYAGPPGSSQAVQVVSADDVPLTPNGSHKHSTLPKRGSLHLMKKDGKEDPSTFVIREEGRDALIISCEDERYVVVAGTFEKLVEQLACEEKPDPRFVSTFLLGYRHFAPAIDFLSILLRRFHMTVAPDATEEEIAYAEKWRYVIQLRVLDILSYWMKKCWPDFCRNPPTLEKVQEFVQFLKESDDTNFQLAGQNLQKTVQEKQETASPQYTLCPPSPASSLPPSTPTSPSFVYPDSPSMTSGGRHPSTSGYCVDISTLTAIQLARQLTLIELEFMKAIDVHELVVYTWEPNTPENKPYRKNLDAFISRFNRVSYWVASEICSIQDARVRGALIEKFIEMAKHCHEYKNFNTTISVVSGLSLTAVKRLKKSWECVGEKTAKSFHKLQQIMSPTSNHTNYRRALTGVQRKDPCIPYFGVFMRDLTFFNDGNRKKLKNGLFNFSKLRTVVLKFEELRRYQRSKYFFPPEDKTREFCRNLWCMSESDLYDASLSVEPRVPPPDCPETSV